jgi:3,4-dihydroxy 2-butanone 4-phosphate synthase/GTP cyclohydrolase II
LSSATSRRKTAVEFKSINKICSAIRRGEAAITSQKRPFVTIAFAQSLDGSIALFPSAPVKLSNNDSLVYTHYLRSAHQAILIGIGTLLADDPLLNVRLVDGESPQPVIVDSSMRFPMKARLIKNNPVKPWIVATSITDQKKANQIEKMGGSVFCANGYTNGWVNLNDMLRLLYDRGVRSVMVEGGAKIISSFLRENLADQVVLTVAPFILGGFRSVSHFGEVSAPFISSLQDTEYEKIGDNLIIWGNIKRSSL